ncbi:MAG: hypothetical protein KatS3mg115_0335 [Candidatus Poribacteria bacterium]|nr:MAG: hypothetical protein KatS3mg115_0335 [Candidatus Poribacteria bacterium]
MTPAEGGGLRVTFLIREYPIVLGEIELIGNKELSYKKLREAFTLKDGERFSDYELWRTQQNLLERYRKEGFYFAKVEPETERTTDSQGNDAVRIRFRITEGERVKVREVRFEGNALLSDKDLRKAVQTRKGKRFDDPDLSGRPQLHPRSVPRYWLSQRKGLR